MQQNKVLVTGINGFVGKHLVQELAGHGIQVVGAGREQAVSPEIADYLTEYYVCELTDKAAVKKLPLSEIDTVISLAGLANVGASFDQPDLYNRVNVAVLSVMAEEIVSQKLPTRVIAVSTGAVYDANQSMPLTEKSKLIESGSPYALSKIAMEKAADDLRDRGLEIAVVRPFNHIGPGQEGGFLVPDLYAKIQTARESDGVIMVGDLSTKRDYTDVRDVVRAYADLALAPTLDQPIYNVCTGHSIDGKTILDTMLKAVGNTGNISVKQDPALIRPNDPKDLYGSNQLLHDATTWQPTIPLEKTIQDFVDSKTA